MCHRRNSHLQATLPHLQRLRPRDQYLAVDRLVEVALGRSCGPLSIDTKTGHNRGTISVHFAGDPRSFAVACFAFSAFFFLHLFAIAADACLEPQHIALERIYFSEIPNFTNSITMKL